MGVSNQTNSLTDSYIKKILPNMATLMQLASVRINIEINRHRNFWSQVRISVTGWLVFCFDIFLTIQFSIYHSGNMVDIIHAFKQLPRGKYL